MDRIPILRMGRFLLVSIQVDMHDRLALTLQDDLTARITETGARGVLIDISALELVDSFIVLYIAFVLGPQHWPLSLFFAVATVNYGYKFVMAIIATPLIYLSHRLIDRYLGPATADEMKARAATA